MGQQIHVGGFNARTDLDERVRDTGHRLVAGGSGQAAGQQEGECGGRLPLIRRSPELIFS